MMEQEISPDVLISLAALIGARSVDAIVIDTGQNSRVFDFGDRILRIPRHADAEAALRREAQLLVDLRPALPISVPDIRMIDSEIGWIAVHDRLPGEPFYSLEGFSGENRRHLAQDLASFMRCLHGLPTTIVRDGYCEESWRELQSRLPSDIFPRLSPAACRAVDAAFRRFADEVGKLPMAVIHGDFGTGNILADGNRVTGVIDFGGCGLGDPAYDLASLSAGLGDEFLSELQSHYPDLTGMEDRILFYRGTFPLSDILFGLDHDDEATLAEGVAGTERLFGAGMKKRAALLQRGRKMGV